MRTSGLEINVVETRFISMPPAWEDIRERTTYFRSRDFMPQYQFGMIEEVEIRRLSSPPSRLTLNKNNRYILNKEIIWFEESFKNEAGTVYSYFGLQKSEEGLRPVVSIQCLAKNFCLELERVESRGT
jgi:hypothetical protein